MPQSDTVTEGIRVQTEVLYIPEQSVPNSDVHFFAYRIRIINEGMQPAQLVNRHWSITDGNGTNHVVQGEGVVGEQPYLNPGDQFQYNSFCPLPTEYGTMEGHFEMLRPDESIFHANVGLFALSRPGSVN